jgi:hypothetical protein
MAHFAKLDNLNKVTQVVVVNNEVIIDADGVEQEQLGVDFLTTLYGSGNYKQTSYNNTFRKNYAGIGFTYDSTRDAFISSQPYGSWLFNEDTCKYEAPVIMPDDGKAYEWDESTNNWKEII